MSFNSQERQSTFASQDLVPTGIVSPFCNGEIQKYIIHLGEVETHADKKAHTKDKKASHAATHQVNGL